jgi:nitroreductase
MNQTIELLQQHCSVRKYTEQKLSRAILAQLLLAGQSAATSSFIQATTVIQVTDPDKRLRLIELTGDQSYVGSAAKFLVFCADLQRNKHRVQTLGQDADYDWTEQFITATIDVALFAQNTVVAAQSLGLGCCYIGGIRNQPEEVCSLLQLPELVYPVFGLCIGYPAQSPDKKPRLPLAVVLHQNNYQANESTDQSTDEYDTNVRNYYERRTSGKLIVSWSEQIAKQSAKQTRPFMLDFLHERGFLRR